MTMHQEEILVSAITALIATIKDLEVRLKAVEKVVNTNNDVVYE